MTPRPRDEPADLSGHISYGDVRLKLVFPAVTSFHATVLSLARENWAAMGRTLSDHQPWGINLGKPYA